MTTNETIKHNFVNHLKNSQSEQKQVNNLTNDLRHISAFHQYILQVASTYCYTTVYLMLGFCKKHLSIHLLNSIPLHFQRTYVGLSQPTQCTKCMHKQWEETQLCNKNENKHFKKFGPQFF